MNCPHDIPPGLCQEDDCNACVKCLERKTAFGIPIASTRMILCSTCGNKRCPRAADHRLACTGSNEPGQVGTAWVDAILRIDREGERKTVSEPPKQDTILEEAAKIYGSPDANLKRIASIWGEVLGHEVSVEQVCLMMMGLKLARLVNSPAHRDSQVDVCGYARLLEMVTTKGA